MKKKIAVPLIICALISAVGLGVYIASNQAIAPGTSGTDIAASTLTVPEINKTFSPPHQLGNVHYTAKSATSLLFFSSRYESLKPCNNQPIAELQLSNQKIADQDISLEDKNAWGHLILHPQGECSDPGAKALYDAAEQMFRQ